MRDGRGAEVTAGIECSRNSSRDEVQKRFVNPSKQGEMFSRALLLRLDPALLASPSIVTSNPPLMHPSGAGLPSTLAYTALNQPDDFKLISDALRVVIPAIDRIRFDKKLTGGSYGGSYGDSIIFDFRGAPSIGAAHASNGTLCALGLLTSILGPDRPRLVLLDDLDHGLHPKAQMELIGVLRALLARFPDLQIIATSHSPYILNQLAWNEVRVTGLRDDGSAICARLEDHPEVERWREAMTPGEFWSHIGDDWVKKLDKPQVEQPQPAPVAL
nr:ATP-binding protein [Gemmata palustris]